MREQKERYWGFDRLNKYVWLAMLVLWIFVLSAKQAVFAAEVVSTTYQIKEEGVNFRKKPSTTSKKITTFKEGTALTYIKKVKSDGQTWYQVKAKVNGKEKKGYVAADYVTQIQQYRFIQRTGYLKVNAAVLYQSPSTRAKQRTTLYKNQAVSVLAKCKADGKNWYQISAKVGKKTYKGYVRTSKVKLYATTVKSTRYAKASTKVKIALYKTANNKDQIRTTIAKNKEVILLGNITVKSTKWRKIGIYTNGKFLTGYTKQKNLQSQTAKLVEKVTMKGSLRNKTMFRKVPNCGAEPVMTFDAATNVVIVATYKVGTTNWYKVKRAYNGKTYYGYVIDEEILLDADVEFERSLQSFPSDYQQKLRDLHAKHPNWMFTAVKTGLDWNTVINNEDRLGVNTISTTVPNGGSAGTYSAPFSYLSTDNGAYNWATDVYKLCDGTTWYTADRAVISYYMDPRNFLAEDTIFMFEALSYDKTQSTSVVKDILSNSFMNGSYTYTDPDTKKKVTRNYADSFVTAGKTYGVSPYFLACRAKQELGLEGSGSVSGTYSGYKGYYNYYNIGANDSAGGGAIANGLNFAKGGSTKETTYGRPWNSPYKAILGGAQFLASTYISKGQSTVYFQKFNVVNKDSLYSHQYMTNVQAPRSEAISAYNSYDNLNVLNKEMAFLIPVYNNMPSSVCALPASAGNPNNYIKTCKITDQNDKTITSYLNKTFTYNTTSYTMTVPNNVNKVKFTLTPVSSYASITTETKNYFILEAGKTTTLKFKCKAGNGKTQTYTFKITRQAS